MSPRVTVALALAPGFVGAAIGPASSAGLLLTLAVHVVLALRVARARAGAPAPEGVRGLFDLAAFVAGLLALVATTLLSSPFPVGAGAASPGRRTALVVGALVLGASVRVVLGARSPQRDPV